MQNRVNSRVRRPCASAHMQRYRAHGHCAGVPYTSAEYLKASYHTGIFHLHSNQFCRKATFRLLPPTLILYTVISIMQFNVIRARAMQSVIHVIMLHAHYFPRDGGYFTTAKKTGLQAHHLQYCIFHVIYQTPSLSLLYHVHLLAYLCPRP